MRKNLSVMAIIMFKTKPRALPWAMFLLTAIMTTNCKHRCDNLQSDTPSWEKYGLYMAQLGLRCRGDSSMKR